MYYYVLYESHMLDSLSLNCAFCLVCLFIVFLTILKKSIFDVNCPIFCCELSNLKEIGRNNEVVVWRGSTAVVGGRTYRNDRGYSIVF